MNVVITKLTNGILYDSSGLTGAGTVRAKKMFTPNNYPSINNITLFDDRVIVTGALGRQFELTINGVNNSFPVESIGGTTVTSIDEIFDNFIALL